ncbi:MAG TPA: DUF2157 domain-containing protein [Candidatus Paceibacterota bacterium]|nr:DUF2157 domain-containing protein [Candidatus Paceibacterota bacterium]HMP18968.1 DUF2157 domain-containing protein [Candidatus Paceibacterota bacterium]
MTELEIQQFIKLGLESGKTKEVIYSELISQGNSIDKIQLGFDILNQEDSKINSSQKTISIVVTFGVILIGAGIFSFIASNWQYMSSFAKVFIILISMIISYAAGFWIKEKTTFTKSGEALILLGSLIYGAGIFLVAQIFNIRANWPDGFILWSVGTIAMFFAVGSYSALVLAIITGFVAVFAYPLGILGTGSGDPFLMTSSTLLILMTIICFSVALFFKKKLDVSLSNFY